MARGARGSGRNRLRWLGALLLLAIVGGGFLWWQLRHWQPPRRPWRVQGVEVSSADGTIDWKALKTVGADFAYVDASASVFAHDARFDRNLEEARAAGLQVGAVHLYDPCQPAEKQAANFVTVVPRDPHLLPPAVELSRDAEDCPIRVSDAAVESELLTFLNQIETHTGKPSILKLSRRFEHRYHLSRAIDRNLWLEQDRFAPSYAGRPFMLWTANAALQLPAFDAPLRWVVVQP
jgi:lysozyme